MTWKHNTIVQRKIPRSCSKILFKLHLLVFDIYRLKNYWRHWSNTMHIIRYCPRYLQWPCCFRLFLRNVQLSAHYVSYVYI